MIRLQDQIKTYHRRKLLIRIAAMVSFAVYGLAWWLASEALVGALAGLIPWRWLLLAVVAGAFAALFELLTSPLDYYSDFILEHRFGLSNETLSGWLVRQTKTYLVGGLIGAILLFGLYGLLWYGGDSWWLWLWIGWLALAVVLAQIFPILILPIFYSSRPVEDDALTERLKRLAAGTGIRISGVFNLNLSKDTKKANAMLAGIGPTRRVFLADTLLEAFTPSQIEVVFAHELGHHVRGHIWKGLALAAAAATAVIAVIAWRLGPFAGSSPNRVAGGIAALPEAILLAFVVQLVLEPPINAVLRRFERQCDLAALQRTGDTSAYREAFAKLGKMNLADPSPHRVVELLFYDHPALAKRLALADEFDRPAATKSAAQP